MLWRYAEKHTTDTQSAERVGAVQASRLADILVLLEEEINGKRFLLGARSPRLRSLSFHVGFVVQEHLRPPSTLVYRMHFMHEMSKRPTVQKVCVTEGIDLSICLE